jgi:hypothetical protein
MQVEVHAAQAAFLDGTGSRWTKANAVPPNKGQL